jgi:hypothetical protein
MSIWLDNAVGRHEVKWEIAFNSLFGISALREDVAGTKFLILLGSF